MNIYSTLLKFFEFHATYILFKTTHEYSWVVWIPWVFLVHTVPASRALWSTLVDVNGHYEYFQYDASERCWIYAHELQCMSILFLLRSVRAQSLCYRVIWWPGELRGEWCEISVSLLPSYLMVRGYWGEQCKKCGRAIGLLWRELHESCHESLVILLQEYLLVSGCPGESCRESTVILFLDRNLDTSQPSGPRDPASRAAFA
jgi:hypothetical protein